MRELTLIMPYYENGGMLREHQRVWRTYPAEAKSALRVIMVDDGSPTNPAARHVEQTGLASFRLCRVLVDVRWNWLFCRNLAVALARTDWILMTDIDHVLPIETLMTILERELDPDIVYRFQRRDAPARRPYKPHPNTWLLTRAMFERVGGYDERFSGFYGTDADFRERVHTEARAVVMLPDYLIRYPREVIADASTTTYGRKEDQDYYQVSRIRQERALIPNWRPLRVSFPWEPVLTIESCVEPIS
jgi:hypothetical protein